MMLFEENKNKMISEYKETKWIESTGPDIKELETGLRKVFDDNKHLSKTMQKALGFSYILNTAQLAVDEHDIFQDKLNHANLMKDEFTTKNANRFKEGELKEYAQLVQEGYDQGFFNGGCDFGHTCPDWDRILSLGFAGILAEIEEKLSKETDAEKVEFYTSCKICYEAIISYINRLAEVVEEKNLYSSTVLRNIAKRAPENMVEAIQTIFIFFRVHENVCGTRNRTLGRIDSELYRFYKNDIESGTFTEEQIRNIIRFFLYKIWNAKVPFDLPMQLNCLIPGTSELNPLSYMIVEEYDALDIYSPKIHVRVSEKTPNKILLRIMKAIRNGHSSFLLVSEEATVKSLVRAGVDRKHAEDFVLIGCYEPAAFATELPCTGNSVLNLLKAFEYAMNDDFSTLDELYDRWCHHFDIGAQNAMKVVSEWEKRYSEIHPDPILSPTFKNCMENGIDIYSGGAVYNNSSVNILGIGSVVDSFAMLKKFVFDEKRISLAEMKNALQNNWEGYEELREEIQNSKERYGNGDAYSDEMTRKISQYCSDGVLNKPNGRGGVFKPGLFSIDDNVKYGAKTKATPDGRKDGDTTSKNLCPTAGKEFGGLTTVIRSVANVDGSLFPNGSVLDLVFHPSAVKGDDGLMAMLGIFKTYFKMGGLSMHINVFDASELRKAQKNPEKYQNLQVRVCGWNAYFVNLTEKEQNDFIKQAETE